MKLNIVVLAKQVPDTQNITADAMKADGTVNRGALPAIFNPEDLNALEMALELKEQYSCTITVMTMGPPRAADILREALYLGADKTVLITDRKFAGADTLATSYVLALGIEKLKSVDLVLCGRQAIDGDTAQIGPQVAGKIGINQITYVDKIDDITNKTITVTRTLGRITETIATQLPLLITVPSSANRPRPFGARRFMKYKKARTAMELQQEISTSSTAGEYGPDLLDEELHKRTLSHKNSNLLIDTKSADELGADPAQIGLAGSPTKVKKVQSVVLTAAERKFFNPDQAGIQALFTELIEDHTFG